MKISAHLIDLHKREIKPSTITIEGDVITRIEPASEAECSQYILPGFVDSHVHVESSLLVPSEFARMAVIHGTVGTISDPHEIGNVLGVAGVEFMLENAKKVPFHFFFGAPSCVPATTFETAGAVINPDDVEKLLSRDDIWYLAEVMNYPGVLNGDPDMLAKIAAAKKAGKPVDGHAPGLRGEDAKKYAAAGISTDHECFTLEEALDKIEAGMYVLIREGSAARNFDALHPILATHPEKVMFCSDDKHPDSLLEGHLNLLVKRALELGYNLFDVLRAASVNTIVHYNLPVGMLREGDKADFILIDKPESFNILETWINGKQVAVNGRTKIARPQAQSVNNFSSYQVSAADFRMEAGNAEKKIRVIEAIDGQLITNTLELDVKLDGNYAVSNPEKDVLKLSVVNRYQQSGPALAFIKNLGLKRGAIASTVAHDSHNIIAAGCSDEAISRAVNLLMKHKGGLCAISDEEELVLPLPVAGLMSDGDAWEVADNYIQIDNFVKTELGSPLRAPFMTLSFMALLVIPQLKLSDKGLFDGATFKFTSPWV